MQELATKNVWINACLQKTQSLTPSQQEDYASELEMLRATTQSHSQQEKKRHAALSRKSRKKQNPTGVVALYWDLVQKRMIFPFDIYYASQIAAGEKIPVGDFGRLTHEHQGHHHP